jgi:hypothetical protein
LVKVATVLAVHSISRGEEEAEAVLEVLRALRALILVLQMAARMVAAEHLED